MNKLIVMALVLLLLSGLVLAFEPYRYTTDVKSMKWMHKCLCTPAYQSKPNYVTRFGGWQATVSSGRFISEEVKVFVSEPEPNPQPLPIPRPVPLPPTCTPLTCKRGS